MSTIMQGHEMVTPAAAKSLRGGYCLLKEASASIAALVPAFAGLFGSLCA
jgi:hypothetical protein